MTTGTDAGSTPMPPLFASCLLCCVDCSLGLSLSGVFAMTYSFAFKPPSYVSFDFTLFALRYLALLPFRVVLKSIPSVPADLSLHTHPSSLLLGPFDCLQILGTVLRPHVWPYTACPVLTRVYTLRYREDGRPPASLSHRPSRSDRPSCSSARVARLPWSPPRFPPRSLSP